MDTFVSIGGGRAHPGHIREIGLVVVGSLRADFPEETERLVLHVAANQAAIGLQHPTISSESLPRHVIPQRLESRTKWRIAAVHVWNHLLTTGG